MEWRAAAERNVAHLRSLLNAVDEPALHYVTGSVIADARGPFLRSALINLGRDDGVRVGYAVINGDGLIGRTVDAGSSVARVLLLSDLNSRIPVLVGPGGVRALVSGDNSAELKRVLARRSIRRRGLPRGRRFCRAARRRGDRACAQVGPIRASALDVDVLFFTRRTGQHRSSLPQSCTRRRGQASTRRHRRSSAAIDTASDPIKRGTAGEAAPERRRSASQP
jgi:hypothetical protein